MGSEIFNLKSLSLEDTVVRGARIGIKNAPTTRTIEVNPGDDPVVKTGEVGLNKDYLIESSLIANDLNGYGTFTNNSEIVTGYTGAQNLLHGDKIKLDVDKISYTVTGIQGDKVYLVEKYTKNDVSDPDVSTGSCSVRKIYLDSVSYERANENVTYDKDKSEWGVTGIQMSDPIVAPSDSFEFDTGVTLQFQKGTSKKSPDIATVPGVYKTVVGNNTSPVSDVSLSPLPYPHSSLQVYMGKQGEELKRAVEGEDYLINYSDGSDVVYPIPPYEEREVAYIKFLSKMTDEVQVSDIDANFSGTMTINRKVLEGDVQVTKPVQSILPTDEFSIKVAGSEKGVNSDYVLNNNAGIVTFVEHHNMESLVDAITYPKKLLWDGISVIRGIKESEVNDADNLVIPGVSGVPGLDYTVYFEDTDANNLIRDTDFIIDPESGAFALSTPLKSTEAVLVSYYVEGDDVKNERVELDRMRLNSYPLIVSSLTLVKKYHAPSDSGTNVTKSRVLVEGVDFIASYVTGHITLMSSDEITTELRASYTPMSQINCIAQSIDKKATDYFYTIVDDVLTFNQDSIGSKRLIFKVNNPGVSVPKKILFDEDKTTGNYNFSGTIKPENILDIKTKDGSKVFNLSNAKYTDLTKEITLDESVNEKTPIDGETVVATYGFESDVLPYAPALLIYTIINEGDTSFVIEGYDKTDVLKPGIILRLDNKDPQSTNYFVIRDVSYNSAGTRVDIYGSFPENAIDPYFYVFDDQMAWQAMSDEVVVDTTASVDAEQIVINRGALFVKTNIKTGALLLIKNQEIYTVTSIETVGDKSTIGIYPKLRSALSSDVKFSRLPIYNEGQTVLPSSQLILSDPQQPAFTLWYNAPEGFEGSAKILFIKEKIVIDEYVSGVKNPVSYEFSIKDFYNIYSLAKAIQATKSTFRVNVPDMGVPDYNPFRVAHGEKEDYFLGEGIWNPETIIPFEEENFISLPYTFRVTPDLYKWSLIELFQGGTEFYVKDANVASLFTPGYVLAFINKISGRYFFSTIKSAEFVSEKDTEVKLTSPITENMVGPYMYTGYDPKWSSLVQPLYEIDYDTDTFKFSGTLDKNIREGTLLYIGSKWVYQVRTVTATVDGFDIEVNSGIDEDVTVETYSGYVKFSQLPINLSNPGVQPFVIIEYKVPLAHTGEASIKVDMDKITIKEVLDNFKTRETALNFLDYENYEQLFDAMKNIESIASGYKPYTVTLDQSYEYVFRDGFNSYKMSETYGEYKSITSYTSMAVAAFDVVYAVPVGYTGGAEIKITNDGAYLFERVTDINTDETEEKETFIAYSNTNNLYHLVENVIPSISSIVSSSIFPFSTVVRNRDIFGLGLWQVTKLSVTDYVSLNKPVYGVVETEVFVPFGNLNVRRLVVDQDYTIENGAVALTDPIKSLDRFALNYMGLNNLVEDEGSDITCSCRFLSYLPAGYRIDVYMEYVNIDQFYIQKLTERKFTEIVTIPQLETIVEQKGSGGQGSDSGSTNNAVPNYSGGLADLNYLLRDEYIKKQLYLRFYHWYKQRLRGLSAELQLGLGFKFGHSNALGEVDGYYTLNDEYVETEDYLLTKDADINQIENGFSKFFPIGYDETAPDYYHRFKNEFMAFNEVFCCNIKYRDDKGNVVTVGVVKSDKPYWNRTSDLVFKIWDDAYINKNLVGYYSVDVPQVDREFAPSNYTFLKVVNTGDKFKIEGIKNNYTIADIKSPDGKTYEYIQTSSPFTGKGIRTFDIVDNRDVSFNTLMDKLPPDGYHIFINRKDKEEFPMFDDYGSSGATAYGDEIVKLKDARRIKKPFFAELFKFLFPLPIDTEPTKVFKIYVKKDSEGEWESAGTIDMSKLTFKEERNVDDVLDALRYDFTEKYTVPIIPPITVYDIEERSDKGFHRYFYISLERIYNDEFKNGYYYGIVIRCKERNWWFKVVDDEGTEAPIIGDYGFDGSKVYKNFYDPDNIYKKLLIEKQAWETEELIVRDLYDHSDKIARAFDQGDLNRKNSKYQGYLAMPDGGTVNGISDILRGKIPAYEKQLRFIIDATGPLYKVLYPDGVHAEDTASPEIALTYSQTNYALSLYNLFYNKLGFFYTLNEDNNYAWKNDYVKWSLSLERGVIYQSQAKQMYEGNAGTLTVGLSEIPTIDVGLSGQGQYSIINPVATVSSTYDGKYFLITFDISDKATPDQIVTGQSCIVYFYTKGTINSVPTVTYKTIAEVCSEIASYSYNDVQLFSAVNAFTHYENNVMSKVCYMSNQVIDPVSGIQLKSANVADHRASDPRVLYLNRKVEDRVYTHEIRELPGFDVTYTGRYYALRYGTPGLTIQDDYNSDKANLRYGVFYDDNNGKVLTIAYERYREETEYISYAMYEKEGDELTYITVQQLSDKIYDFSSSVVFANRSKSCELFLTTSGYIDFVVNTATPYIALDIKYESVPEATEQFYYKIYKDSAAVKKMDILFYELIADGRVLRKSSVVADTFTFSFKNANGSFKTIDQFCGEVSAFVYKGERLFSLKSVYEAVPKGGLSTSYVIAEDVLLPSGYDWDATVYVDTYTEAISGKDANSRTISSIKNAVFSFPLYTANGNPNKLAIEDIPVAGKWDTTEGEEIIEIECLDGVSWGITFSDYDSGDYKSYMTPTDILEAIDSGKPITEDQYNQIKVIEDKPSVAVLKELVLIRKSDGIENEARFNLRKYNTIDSLIDAIIGARFNDAGEPDTNGNRYFFTASLIGEHNIQGQYKSYELDASYSPIIRSFTVNMNDGTNVYKSNQLIGWETIRTEFPVSLKSKLSMAQRKYSQSQTYKFTAYGPDRAYNDTLYNNPQGFRRDILAFDIYSWDSNARYEIKNNWIYFRSDYVDYNNFTDAGQPNKTLGYGIPLARSGHPQVSNRESLLDLINRINSNAVVNKWFYANLKFTRDITNNPGYFEYNYLPDIYSDVPKSTLDDIKLKNDNVMSVGTGNGYTFVASNIAVDDTADTLGLSCDWRYDYTFESTFYFNDNLSIAALTASINSALAPQIPQSIIEPNSLLPLALTTKLIQTFIEKPIGTTYTDLNVNLGGVPTPALQLRIRNVGPTNYVVNKVTYRIPRTRDRLILKCNITYQGVYNLSGYDLASRTVSMVSNFVSTIRPYPDNVFNPLFVSSVVSEGYGYREANRLMSMSSDIFLGGTPLMAKLDDLAGFKVLNMAPQGTLNINNVNIGLVTFKVYNHSISLVNDIPTLVDSLYGDYVDGFISCDVLPIKVDLVTTGILNSAVYTLTSGNTPAHVYFGMMGDIKFVQISDHNLHMQYNYIKERLGMPWRDEQGNLDYDYYTPETYNENNPCAIDLNNFLGYLRTGRYNQISNSIANEGIVSNKYLWLYMKFHKEFGCDQLSLTLKNRIQSGNTDMNVLNQML